ncbi:MAG: T9SS type A sorting domain-containing protein [Ignavibacteriae bacterium]|nr:T9SS type A sorting domain-containing protein [Ignavibacteriota bacterium]
MNVINHIPFYFAVGNHEGWLQNTMAFTQDSRYSGTEGYYSFDYGFMHVLAINNEVNCDSGSAQYNFAYNDLATTTKPWKIVIYHKPAYCCAGEGENTHMKNFSRNIFVPLHVDMVFNGHSHFYQHNLVSGLHHMIIGSAGAELQIPRDTTYTVKSVMDYNFGVIDVTLNDFTVLVYNNLNVLLDSVRLHKSVGIKQISSEVPSGYSLNQNYPNPFNPSTNIRYQILNSKFITLKIYDILGKEIVTLINEKQLPGVYEVKWDASNYPSGLYLYRLQAVDFTDTKKLILLK